MKTIAQIAAELQGYDPQALSAADVNQFLDRLVEPVTATEVLLPRLGQRVRDVRQGPDGLLYLLTDSSNGQLMRVLATP